MAGVEIPLRRVQAFFIVVLTVFWAFPTGLVAMETVDMGPVKGSAKGSIWSKVVDEVGNTHGRAEVWHLTLTTSVIPEFIVRCGDPSLLGAMVKWRGEYGDYMQWPLDGAPGGRAWKSTSVWAPARNKEITIVISPLKPVVESQAYQLIINLYDPSGKLLGSVTNDPAPAKPASEHPAIGGAWNFIAGHPKGSVITIKQNPDGAVVAITCTSVFSNGDRGVNVATSMRWESATKLTYTYHWTERSTPNLQDGEASIIFESDRRATIGARDTSGNSARDVLTR